MRWPMVSMKYAAALFAAGGLPLLAYASTPAEATHSPKSQKELSQALAGRTAGPAVECVYNYPAMQTQTIDQWTVLFRRGSTVYVQNPRGGCPGLGTPGYTLVTRAVGGNRMCSGDIARLADLSSGTSGGSCILGPFVPYTKPK